MKRKLVFTAMMLASICLNAQNVKPKFSSLLQVGLMEGQSGSAASIQTINGVQWKTWSAGVGVGIDYSFLRSVPLFLDVRKNVLKGEKTPFVYVDTGYNFPWLTEDHKMRDGIQNADGGLYYDAGIGYSLPVLKQSALFFTAGYSSKKMSTDSGWMIALPFPDFVPQLDHYEYTLNRISIKAGLRF